ncbi:hypothetical protein GCM10009746_20740 [Microbacterium paludicola]
MADGFRLDAFRTYEGRKVIVGTLLPVEHRLVVVAHPESASIAASPIMLVHLPACMLCTLHAMFRCVLRGYL